MLHGGHMKAWLIVPALLLWIFFRAVPVWPQSFLWLECDQPSESIVSRISVPDGHQRVPTTPGSFERWLRRLPLKKGHPPVRLFDGQEKRNQEAHFAVIDIDVGPVDLQQCADAVIRLRAEYLYSQGAYESIHFDFTSGHTAAFRKWIQGYRPVVRENEVVWFRSAGKDSSYSGFRAYLQQVFSYAGSYSLGRELKQVTDISQMNIGDVFIEGGFPGHAVIVLDMAAHRETGKKSFLLAQSYMPAQDIHILKNPLDDQLDPWYVLEFGDTLHTPEWTFSKNHLKRF